MNVSPSLRMINLGCGHRFHPDWVNVDIDPSDPAVTACDLSQPLPFAEGNFDVVYHSNVLEHIRREQATGFLRECGRILKPGGILRVAVPDLERICSLYLEKLQQAAAGDAAAAHDYDWMLLEMYDQTVREKCGGGMLDYLRQDPLPNEPFVLERIGQEGSQLIDAVRSLPPPAPQSPTQTAPAKQHAASPPPPNKRPGLREIIRRPRTLFEMLRGKSRVLPEVSAPAPAACNKPLSAEEQRALDIGRFRLAGEVHQWMYDRFSLARLMKDSGFVSPQLMTPQSSKIPGWADFHLEVGTDGAVHKPDSFVMECLKPG